MNEVSCEAPFLCALFLKIHDYTKWKRIHEENLFVCLFVCLFLKKQQECIQYYRSSMFINDINK